jgi:hypothetical protein
VSLCQCSITPKSVVFLGPNDFQKKHIERPEPLPWCRAQPYSKTPFGLAHRARLAEARCRQKRCPCVFDFLRRQRASYPSTEQRWRPQVAARSSFTSIPSPDHFRDHLAVLAIIGMILRQNFDQLLVSAIPKKTWPALLWVGRPPRRRRVICGVINVEAVNRTFRWFM